MLYTNSSNITVNDKLQHFKDMFYVGSCSGIGVGEGRLAMIFASSFMFLFTLYLNTHGSSRRGRILFGGGSKLKSSHSTFSDIIFGYIMLTSGAVCAVLIDSGVFRKDIGVLFLSMRSDLLRTSV